MRIEETGLMTDNGSTTREEDVPPLSDAVTQDEDVAQGGHASASVPSNCSASVSAASVSAASVSATSVSATSVSATSVSATHILSRYKVYRYRAIT